MHLAMLFAEILPVTAGWSPLHLKQDGTQPKQRRRGTNEAKPWGNAPVLIHTETGLSEGISPLPK